MPEISDRLKSVFDTTIGSLPYCIAATTEDEWQKHIAGETAFTRRFQKIDVEPTTEEQTLLILREAANREAQDVGISEDSLKKISKLTSERMKDIISQPAAGKRVLNNAFTKIRERQRAQYKSPEMQKKLQKLANLSSALHAEPDSSIAASQIAEISELKKEIGELRVFQEKVQKKFKVLSNLKRYRAEQVKLLFDVACRIEDAPKNSIQETEQNRKIFHFLNYYSIPTLRSQIQDMHKNAEESSLEIDETLINELIDKEILADKKKKQAEKEAKAHPKPKTETRSKNKNPRLKARKVKAK